MSLSVGIITFNEEKRIGRTLEAIREIADEIIIVDSGSTDKTEEICKDYGAKFFVEKWKGYGLQKNSVIDKCTKNWILLIDADEVVSHELKNKILKIKKENIPRIYEINFTSVCFEKKIKYGGWSKSYRIRLFYNGSGRYNDNIVHEEFVREIEISRLTEEIYHYSYEDLEDYLSKFNRYTTEGAKEYYKRNKKVYTSDIVLKPWFVFFKMYFIRFGFLDGLEGFLLAILSANYTLVKYFKLKKLYEEERFER